jgi:hypothetical protein
MLQSGSIGSASPNGGTRGDGGEQYVQDACPDPVRSWNIVKTRLRNAATPFASPKRSFWSVIRSYFRGPVGSGSDQICAWCGVMVTPEGRHEDSLVNNVYCSREHYLEGLADRSW